eukprot:scaffold5970_cov69-Phaeocystis_antarctica.AAC.3
MQASIEVTSNRPMVTSSCSRPCTDLRLDIGPGVARLLGVRLPERAVPFVRRRYAAETALRRLLPLSRRGGSAPGILWQAGEVVRLGRDWGGCQCRHTCIPDFDRLVT